MIAFSIRWHGSKSKTRMLQGPYNNLDKVGHVQTVSPAGRASPVSDRSRASWLSADARQARSFDPT